jgi:hypothetical protein
VLIADGAVVEPVEGMDVVFAGGRDDVGVGNCPAPIASRLVTSAGASISPRGVHAALRARLTEVWKSSVALSWAETKDTSAEEEAVLSEEVECEGVGASGDARGWARAALALPRAMPEVARTSIAET